MPEPGDAMNMQSLNLGEPRWLTRVAAGAKRKVRRSIKRRGEFGTVIYIAWYITFGGPVMVARKLGLIRPSARPSVASMFDCEHGVDTAAHIQLGDLEIKSRNVREGCHYAPTSPKYFKEMMPHLNIRHEQFTFVDVGCGKGLVLLLASAYPFRRIIGVEFSDESATIASRNLVAYVGEPQGCKDIQCVCMDAVEYEFPCERLVIYFYNSFKGKVLKQFAANIAQTIADHPRDLFIVYNNPTEPDVFDAIHSIERVFDDPDYLIYRTRGRASEGNGS